MKLINDNDNKPTQTPESEENQPVNTYQVIFSYVSKDFASVNIQATTPEEASLIFENQIAPQFDAELNSIELINPLYHTEKVVPVMEDNVVKFVHPASTTSH